MSLGNNIFTKRKEKGMTQDDLAERLNVSRQTISEWERDVKKPKTQKLIDLAKLLDVPMDWLCADELAGSETTSDTQAGENEELLENKPDGRVLKIAPAMLEFAEKLKDITTDMYIPEDKEDGQ